MKKYLLMGTFVIFSISVLIHFTGCSGKSALSGDIVYGDGKIKKENRNIYNISAVKLDTFFDLNIETGKEDSLSIKCEKNLLPYIATETDNGRLIINTRSGIKIKATRKVLLKLTVKRLNTIVLNGSGNINVANFRGNNISIIGRSSGSIETGKIKADKINLIQDGSGSLRIKRGECAEMKITLSSSGVINAGRVVCEQLNAHISSSGYVKINKGRTKEQYVSVTGSGSYMAIHFESFNSEVKLTSSGNAQVKAKSKLSASLTGTGNLYYKGKPFIQQKCSGQGKVINKN